MEVRTTACPLDCPDGCTLEVKVEGGKLVSIDGGNANPLTAGFICSKVRDFGGHVYGRARLSHPAVRTGPKGSGEFRRASWDEALDLVAKELTRVRDGSGGEGILPLSYGGSNGKLTQDGHDALLFGRLGATVLERTVCAVATGAAAEGLYGKMAGVAFDDYEHAKCVVLWGANPSSTGIHFVPLMKRAQAAGAKLVVVDPRRIPLAKKADLHVPIRPGTDLVLALALMRYAFENDLADRDFLREHTTGWETLEARAAEWTVERAAELCGLEPSMIETFARLYAESSPSVVRCGWGLERNRNGGSAAAAVLGLPAVLGHFGVRGGGYTMSNSSIWGLDSAAAIGAPPETTRRLNMNRTGRALLEYRDPPIELAFVYNHNPLATLPNQELVRKGLEREDLFTVVFEQVMTDTARYADVLLPATTFLEHEDLGTAYGGYALQDVHPVIDRVGEARSNAEVFAELCERVGVARPEDARNEREHRERLLAGTPWSDGLRSALDEGGAAEPPYGNRPVQFADVFPNTPDSKVHLVPEDLDEASAKGMYVYLEDPGSETFPLALLSPSNSRTISSTLGQLHDHEEPLFMHPADAAQRGLTDGELVRVWNTLGEVLCPVSATEELRPGVVALAKGLWSHNTRNGRTANALAPDTVSDVGGSACFNDARVQVARA